MPFDFSASFEEMMMANLDECPIVFDSFPEEDSVRAPVAGPSTMRSVPAASSPAAPFAKVPVPTTQERARSGLLTSRLTAALRWLGEPPRQRRQPPADPPRGVVITSVRRDALEAIEERNLPWICCNCETTNEPFDFLCWFCKTHSRCAKCVVSGEVEIDGFTLPPKTSMIKKYGCRWFMDMPLVNPRQVWQRLKRPAHPLMGKVAAARVKGLKSSPSVKVSDVKCPGRLLYPTSDAEIMGPALQ